VSSKFLLCLDVPVLQVRTLSKREDVLTLLVVSKCPAIAFDVIACKAIKTIMPALSGLQLFEKCLVSLWFLFIKKLIGCKYMRNYPVSQNVL